MISLGNGSPATLRDKTVKEIDLLVLEIALGLDRFTVVSLNRGMSG